MGNGLYLAVLGERGDQPLDVGREEGSQGVVPAPVELLGEAVPQVEGDVGDLVVRVAAAAAGLLFSR